MFSFFFFKFSYYFCDPKKYKNKKFAEKKTQTVMKKKSMKKLKKRMNGLNYLIWCKFYYASFVSIVILSIFFFVFCHRFNQPFLPIVSPRQPVIFVDMK